MFEFITAGHQITDDQSKLLGKLLKAISTGDDFVVGVSIKQLIDCTSNYTLEELQLALAKYPTTRALSDNLQKKLNTSKLVN